MDYSKMMQYEQYLIFNLYREQTEGFSYSVLFNFLMTGIACLLCSSSITSNRLIKWVIYYILKPAVSDFCKLS